MSELSAKRTPRWKDLLLLAAELAARNAFWRLPWLRTWVKRRRARRSPAPQVAQREDIKTHLRNIGVTAGALVMVHTSVRGFMLLDAAQAPGNKPGFLAAARSLVDDLLALLGPSGTLVMPTHTPQQTAEDAWSLPVGRRAPIVYDPARTPCAVGLANELFRRRPGVERSLHPYNTLSAFGPLAKELLHDNLNDLKPLPHGIHSGYYRFCQRNGLVVSIGVRLGDCITLVHTAEDVRDQDFPADGFFEERRYLVRIGGDEREVVVRHPRLEYSMYCRCHRKLTRDLIGAGILHEDTVGSVRVGWAHSREVFEYMMQRNQHRPYPLYCTWLVRKRR